MSKPTAGPNAAALLPADAHLRRGSLLALHATMPFICATIRTCRRGSHPVA